MKAKKIIYMIGGVACCALTIILLTLALLVALVNVALDAMAFEAGAKAGDLYEEIKRL